MFGHAFPSRPQIEAKETNASTDKPDHTCPKKKSLDESTPRHLGVALYLISTVPVGMTLYAIKTEMGWDIFKHGGFHALASCLREAARP
jgi:hypothetical protein